MTIRIDRRIYSDECISKAIYSLAEKYIVERSLLNNEEEELSILLTDEVEDRVVRTELFSKLNDYKLRCIIEQETHDIRTILYAKAFAEFDDITEKDLD